MGDWSDIANASAATAQAAASMAAPAIKNRSSWKYTKKAMQLQNEYNTLAYERSRDDSYKRQDYLMENANLITKKSLAAAGYSTADPNGTGVTPAPAYSQQQSPVSNSQFQSADFPVDFISPFLALSQAKKTSSEARLNEIEEKYRALLLEGQVGKLNIEIKQATDLLPERIEEIRANVQNLISKKDLNEKEGEKVMQEVENLKGILTGIQIDNKWKDDLSRSEFNKRNAEIQNLIKDGRIKEAEAKIADMGIVLGKGTLGTIVSAALNGKADKIGSALSDSFSTLIKGLPDFVGSLLTSVFETFKNTFFGDGKNKEKSEHLMKMLKFIGIGPIKQD